MILRVGERVLGLEGGGTKTAWVVVETNGADLRAVEQGKLPASNFRLTPPDRLRAMFSELPREIDRAGVFLAGCAPEDRPALTTLCREIWPRAQIVAGSDRDSGMAAALEGRDGIVVNAGTGSSVTGRRGEQIEKAGGWGHILGDAGGGYYISVQALRLLLREYDVHRGQAEFAADVLRALCLNSLNELVRWAQTADKMDVATLAPVVFEAANHDPRVREILRSSAHVLAEYTAAVARRLGFETADVVLIGGLFTCCSIYAEIFRAEVADVLPRANIDLCTRPPELGAAWLALEDKAKSSIASVKNETFAVADNRGESSLAAALTEQRNPRSERLDKLTMQEVVELFVEEERSVQEALRACVSELTDAARRVATVLREGGRLFYVGAGTSGRLGVLDASEIPPTFSAPPELVQGIIAGGVMALYRSVEGAEDESAAGALTVDERGVRSSDIICGITASGRTPFVLGALTRAKTIGAGTILLTCNPAAAREPAADLQINLPTGPELITGSTRLKAGTATKAALNIISSGAMIALGKVRGNLMIDVSVSNAKLRDRAARIVGELAGCSYEDAVARLTAANWNLRAAIEQRL